MENEYSNLLLFLLVYPDKINDIRDEERYRSVWALSKNPYKERLMVARKEYIEFMYKERGEDGK